MKKFLLAFFVLFTININVNAASLCSYEEQTNLNSKAANVKVSYEVVEETIHNLDMDTTKKIFNVSIFNITEEFYVIIKNNFNNEEKIVGYNETKNGIYTFKWEQVEEITNFTIQVYTSDNSNCPDEKYKTLYLTTPRYNIYSDREICSELENFYLCEEFVTFSKIEDDEFLNKLKKYQTEEIEKENNDENKVQKDEEKSTTDKIYEFLDNNKWFIIGGVLLVLTVIILINRKKLKKQRDLGL